MMSRSGSDKERYPWRATIDFTFVGPLDPEAASRIWDQVDDAVVAITGIPTEGGSAGRMEEDEVVLDSPLHQALKPAPPRDTDE